jgi:hypothetical protein
VSADSKYGRNEATSTNNQLNSSAAPPQLSQQQQQPPINLIPNLINPFFFHSKLLYNKKLVKIENHE